MAWIALFMALVACAGIGQALFGLIAVRRFMRRVDGAAMVDDGAAAQPPITVLKPLHGDEPMLEAALASVLRQNYRTFQVVFGVQDPADPAIAVVTRLRARFPGADIALVVDPAQHGINRKIGNLINMLPAARHDLLVIADSDVHVGPDYLQRIADELARPGVGVATTVYAGLAANASLPAILGGTMITHGFLPGALMARILGRRDCLGATMALRRETLEAIGGLPALCDHIADDHVLGKLVRGRGLAVNVAATFTTTTVPETAMPDLFQHELRWSRTILALVPREYVLSFIQYPLFWAGLAIGCSGGSDWAVALFIAAWAARAGCARGIDRAIPAGAAGAAPIWLLPLRDIMSMAIALVAYTGDRVEWRGRVMHTKRGAPIAEAPGEATTAYSAGRFGYAPASYVPPGPPATS